ncbi:MAG TPA: ankyrin repeat domain-containing protein [Clostridia bacterium]|nr:ankyrin repeat domain-containing protein [Clostridia bacterium]
MHSVKKLLSQGAKPDGFMEEEGAPLYEAVKTRNVKIVSLLLKSGANPNLGNVLAHACEQGFTEIAALLVQHGADPNRGRALEFAISNDHPQAVKFLLEHGAKIKSGLLDWAVRMPHAKEIIRLMINAGADVNHHDNDHLSDLSARARVPLHLTGNNLELTKLLLAAGADPNRQLYFSRNTPLFSAARHGNLKVARMLLAAGANPRHVNAEGKTAHQIAKKHGHRELAVLLKNYTPTPQRKKKKTLHMPGPSRGASQVRRPEIIVPKLSGSAIKFATGLSDFILLANEYGGSFGLIAVESPIEEVTRMFKKLVDAHDMRANIEVVSSRNHDSVSNRWIAIVQPTDSSWTILYRHIWFNLDGIDEKMQSEAKALSTKLKARIFVCLANTDGAVCRLFNKGDLVGVSMLSSVDKVNRMLKWLRLYVPECYLTEEEETGLEVVCLAVRHSSKGKIAAAAAVKGSFDN